MSKQFAPGIPRIDHKDFKGLVDFPTQDADLRRQYFIEEVMHHGAKANLHLVNAIIDYVSEPGERIMDIMSGTGSILIATIQGRPVTCIEISEKYAGWIRQNYEKIKAIHPNAAPAVIINLPAQRALPMPCDHIIFSPPYANIMRKTKMTKGDITASLYGLSEEEQDDFMEYEKQPENVGNRNRFFYNQEMEKIYKLCLQSVRPGGTLSIIIKDYIENDKRVFLSDWVVKVCLRMGWKQYDWYKWPALGSPYTRIYRAQGRNTVDDEDIIIFQRPE